MPSSIAHAMIGVAAGAAIAPRTHVRPFLVIAAACAVIPDVDAIGRMPPMRIRKGIYLLFLVLVAFWGWRSEAKMASDYQHCANRVAQDQQR